MPWHNAEHIKREEEQISFVSTGGRSFYIKKSGRQYTPHRSFSDAMWDRVDDSIRDLFSKKELANLFSKSKVIYHTSQ